MAETVGISHFPQSIKMTRNRRSVINVLSVDSSPNGLTVTDIYAVLLQQGRPATLGSIYRNVDELYRHGKADRLEVGRGARRYRLRDARETDAVCIVPRQGDVRIISSPALIREVNKALAELGLQFSPGEMVTIRIG